MPSKTSKRTRKTTSVSFKRISGTPSFVHIRPMKDKLTAKEFNEYILLQVVARLLLQKDANIQKF